MKTLGGIKTLKLTQIEVDYGPPLEELSMLASAWPQIAALKTPSGAAAALHRVLVKAAVEMGQAETEVLLHSPNESADYLGNGDRCWRVIWEAGPMEWGVTLSMNPQGENWYTEPYYSFDVCFREA